MSLKALVSIFLGLGTSAVTPLVFSKPEEVDMNEQKFELKNCVLNTWGSSTSHFFKCQRENKVWAFYLSSTWNQWFYGRTTGRSSQSGRGGQGSNNNDLSNVVLTLEKGHKKIVVTGKDANINKELPVVWLESQKRDKNVYGYAPESINKQTNSQSGVKQQILSSFEGLRPESQSAAK